MQRPKAKALIGSCVFVFLLWPTMGLQAQQGDVGAMLEEIVITAERRTGRLQSTPASVVVVSNEDIADSGANTLNTLPLVVPGLTLNDFASNTLVFLRGAGSATVGQGNYSSVAIYLDGTYLARPSSILFELNSVESVQVLKGPQGSLYGRNATAGAILIETEKAVPRQELSGGVSASYGRFDQYTLQGDLSGGLGDQFAFNLGAMVREHGGYINNPLGADLADRDSEFYNGRLSFQASDALAFELGAYYNTAFDRQVAGAQSVTPDGAANFTGFVLGSFGCQLTGGGTGPAGTCSPAEIGAFFNPATTTSLPTLIALGAAVPTFQFGQPADELLNAFQVGASDPDLGTKPGSFQNLEEIHTQFKIDYESNAVRFEATSSWTDHKQLIGASVLPYTLSDGGTAFTDFVATLPVPLPLAPLGQVGFSANIKADVFSQEAILASVDSPIEWIVGASYFQEEGEIQLIAGTFGLQPITVLDEYEVESYSVFAEATFPLADDWSVAAGIRYTDENYDLIDNFQPGNPAFQPGLPNAGDQAQSFDELAWSIVLAWQVTEDSYTYASAKTGFKSGVLNASNPLAGGVEPEKNLAFEVGLKSKLWAGRSRLNISAYLYDYENIHVNTADTTTGATLLIDGAEAEFLGVDIDFVVLLSQGLTLTAGVAFVDAKFTNDASRITPTGLTLLPLDGNAPAGAADVAASLGLNYETELPGGTLSFNSVYAYNSGYFHEAENVVGTGGLGDDSYGLLNLSSTYRADSGWYVRAWGMNVTDEEYFRSGVLLNGINGLAIQAPPAEYGLTLGIEF